MSPDLARSYHEFRLSKVISWVQT